ncbi:aspartate/glutamate racemase family protein [Tumebacillus sp. ITR2]|uniref:Aspartate/glutamate racemase family protein n=1 Tax=Tumebacillus amylolyticus TaxID=2801339 RepID=A0ABS1JBQ3_9BACL|nr:aspartate/glutamate racemase family protein [Tumebacillus amylolyticus]MBL0387698.1 aspartate/glutamate racemase family protein [Tumebacillus amylolyticus]
MKTIGLLGGMSWESTAVYYRQMNEEIRNRAGGLHSAKILLHSFDFAEIVAYQTAGDWKKAAGLLLEAARRLEAAGADLLLICTNTMHQVADDVQAAVTIPLVHIVDVTAEAIAAQGLKRIGLLGTKYTMSMDFYRERMKQHGIELLVPPVDEQTEINRVIFEELCQGIVKKSSRDAYQETVRDLKSRGAQGIILGCTEIMLLLNQDDLPLPMFDSTTLHVQKAVELAMHSNVLTS